MLGMIVCALSVYALFCINAITFTMFAAKIASGRRPSKLTINTRALFGGGVDVIVGEGVSVAGGDVLLGLGVTNCVGAIAGGGRDVTDSHDDSRITRRVKCKMRRIIFRMISPALAFLTHDVLRLQSQFHNPRRRDVPRPCLGLL